ncbi:MAG: hypothetical protein Q9Q13_06425 [Acidobacteriota bacterium]|nr:hypothetical protein [Acidobacteriota bacterium]
MRGIAWNTVDGVPVEGSTSLGWMLLAALGMVVGLDPVGFTHFLGILAGAAAMVVSWRVARDRLGLSPLRALAAPLVLALGRQWLVWAVAGLETRAATLLVLVATARLALEIEDPGRRAWISGLLFFLATVFRPEVPLLHLAAGAGLAVAAGGRDSLKRIALSGLVHGAWLLGLCGWRMALFGKPLPNTFYAKVGGVQLSLGLTYVGQFLAQNFAWIWLPLIVAGVWWARRRLPLLVPALLAQALFWTTWVAVEGGGAWEFRFFRHAAARSGPAGGLLPRPPGARGGRASSAIRRGGVGRGGRLRRAHLQALPGVLPDGLVALTQALGGRDAAGRPLAGALPGSH